MNRQQKQAKGWKNYQNKRHKVHPVIKDYLQLALLVAVLVAVCYIVYGIRTGQI